MLDLIRWSAIYGRFKCAIEHILGDPDQLASHRKVVNSPAVIDRVDDRGRLPRPGAQDTAQSIFQRQREWRGKKVLSVIGLATLFEPISSLITSKMPPCSGSKKWLAFRKSATR